MNAMVTTPEAAAYLDVTPPHIRLLLYRGDLEGKKIGRDLWITKESLAAYKKNRCPAGRPSGTIPRRPSESTRSEDERKYKHQARKGKRPVQKKGSIAGRTDKKGRSSKKG
jgi:excisionase family DNA binding protein